MHFRLKLATLYVQLGQSDDALSLLEAEPGGEEGLSYHGNTATPEFDPCNEIDKEKSQVSLQ